MLITFFEKSDKIIKMDHTVDKKKNIIEFIKKTWPDITTKLQKKKGKKL